VNSYDVFKFLHVTGVVMLMGNITATAIWKFFADRDGRPEVLGFAQKLITYTDWSLTAWGAGLTMVGGYGLALAGGFDLFGTGWLAWSQALFALAGGIWVGIIVPIQIRQARAAKLFERGGEVPESYRRDARRWIFWGLVSTVPLVWALWLMVAKPL
jgi:uncharacterized membrane protein